MPDDPLTMRDVDPVSRAATFREGVERVDETTPGAVIPAEGTPPATSSAASAHARKVRARKVRRIVRHIEPSSVLKISLLFYAALFLIVCVASAALWIGARAAGAVDNLESVITTVGAFGKCEPIDGAAPPTATPQPGALEQAEEGQVATALPEPAAGTVKDGDCRPGEQLVGEFKFRDARILEAFALGGIVLVLAGSAANVVMVLLFNLMSDLTGGVRVTVLEEDVPARSARPSGSPRRKRRG
ncbi:MAG: DUF3566 domain-containing protein [Microthrixaceae bacterium]